MQGSHLPRCLAAAGAVPEKSPQAVPIDSPLLLAFGSFIFPSPAGQESNTPSTNRARLNSLPPFGLQPHQAQ